MRLSTRMFLAIALIFPAAARGQVAENYEWLRSARTFLVDAYQYPFQPELEYDARALARTMADMHANTVRFGTMGRYCTIQGARFSTHPDQGGRDLLSETIEACRPLGIRVVPYISTGHKLDWEMITEQYPEYAQRVSPDGGPHPSPMFLGPPLATVCWNTPYRRAFLDLVEHVVRDYEIDGIYFDSWFPHYFWPAPRTCYCPGCKEGFREATGLEIPYRPEPEDYTERERRVIDRYHEWYREQLIDVLVETRRIVKSYRDIPLIYNINNPQKIVREDPRVIANMDAFLYERGHTMLERAEGVSLARDAGLSIWPYIGSYDNWPRVVHNGLDFQQEIYTTAAFGGGPIISQPYAFVRQPGRREIVRRPFGVLSRGEDYIEGFSNVPHVAVVYGLDDPPGHRSRGWWWESGARSSSLGAFAACLHGHIQVSSALPSLLDHPERLARYSVLYLADITHLSPSRLDNVREFVANGGGLVASYCATLYDSDGEKRESFALGDLLGVRPAAPPGSALADSVERYRAMLGGPNDLYVRARAGVNGELDRWSGALVPLWFYQPVEAVAEATVAADIVSGVSGRPLMPAVVLTSRGRGRTAYLASSLESLYLGSNMEDLAGFVRTLVEAVTPEGRPAPFTLDAPRAVMANMTGKGNTRVVHLVNWTGNKLERNLVSEYYIAPLEDVRLTVRIPEGRRVASVSTLVQGDFSHSLTAGGSLEVLIPRMGAYQAVAVRFE